MTENPNKIRARVSTLTKSLDELEAKLEPLLAQSLPETLVGLEPIQQAKLQVAIPYLVYDLIFIYLKTKGVDPKTHPVIKELDRIRQYFDKIKNAEDPEKRRTTVDKAAANRFIKHAIAQVKLMRTPGEGEAGPSNTHIRFDEEGNSEPIPVKVTSKMLARAQYEKELKEQGSEEEGDLEVYEEGGDAEMEDEAPEQSSSKQKGKGKAVAEEEQPTELVGRKRRRPPMDPFQGYGDDPKEPPADSEARNVPTSGAGDTSSGRSTPMSASDSTSQEQNKKEKNAAKKARKKARRAAPSAT
ncbi:hypothetical protein QCA50_010285 [Cerrena zonata]|uniref:Exosome complex protein n=1 Tax=Cerrena zonata TaxID=2478898 RepID=A0AAW0FZQ9_9APHY